MCVCTQWNTQPKNSEILPFATTWMDLKDIMLQKISQIATLSDLFTNTL